MAAMLRSNLRRMPSRKEFVSMEVREFMSKQGKKGAKARAKALTAEQRTAIARKAAAASAKVRSAKAKARKSD